MRRELRRRGARQLHRRDPALHRLLHLLEGAHLDLAHALARDAEFVGEILERDRVVGEAPRLEDAALALVEHGERLAERLAAGVRPPAPPAAPPPARPCVRPPPPPPPRIARPAAWA